MHLSILHLPADRRSGDTVSDILSRAGHTVAVAQTADELVGQAPQHALLIVDGAAPVEGGAAALVARVRAVTALSGVPILCIARGDDLEERIAYLEAGADDVVRKPFDPRELEALVEALALRAGPGRAAVAGVSAIGGSKRRRLVVVYSPKGGVGTTTIAVNLAVLAAERHPEQVALVDLDLQFGQVATHLNLEVRQSLLELIRDTVALGDAELLRTYATPHSTGVQVFASPPAPGFANLFTAAHVESILDRAAEAYETVVVDAGNALDDLTLSAIARAETLVIPVIPEIPSLKAVHALLEQLAESGTSGARTLFVLNNIFSRDLLRLRDIEQALGGKIATELPYDPFLYLKAVNVGAPAITSAGRTPPAERLRRLADIVFGPETGDAKPRAAAAPERRSRGIGGLLRRG